MPEGDQNQTQILGGIITGDSGGNIDPTTKRVASIERVLLVIITVLIATTLTLLVSVATLIIDSFRFNSVTYREYSSRYDTNQVLLETNQDILNENKLNQEILINLLQEKTASTSN